MEGIAMTMRGRVNLCAGSEARALEPCRLMEKNELHLGGKLASVPLVV